MSAIKLSARIFAAAAAALGFAASCGQLLGDYEVQIPALRAPDAASGPKEICTLGATQCDGRLLQLCTDEGTAWATLEACATPELCRASDTETVSSCIAPACSAEQMSCDGNQLRLCNDSRTGWELFSTCETAAHCDAGRRQCLPAPCEPGARRCNIGSLERCNDSRTGWELLDTCVTNELCEVTLAPAAVVGEVLSADDLTLLQPGGNAEGPTECRGPVCVPREVRCELNRLNACNEGQTDLALAEECATPSLCDASITYTGVRGSPRCVRPACAAGEHRCDEAGVLEVCNADRDGYDPIEACIGPQFCNAVAADNGEPGCEDAPCEAGDEQCNGPQIQRCLPDRTGFEEVGAACETRGLCNDDNATAFCAAPACRRGPLSGTEFSCQGATLLRCNDQHTGFDPIGTCATAALCNAGLGFNGCQPPVCAPLETRCNGNFVQRCNADRTAFENVEQCQPGTCDSQAGRCADPCVLGSARCNAQGNLEECRSLLVGREVTARCGSVQLCDANTRTCHVSPAGCTADGVRRCRAQGQGTVLEQCTEGRSRFATLDTCEGGEVCDANDLTCDVCTQGSEPTCQGNTLVRCSADGKNADSELCANGCQTVATGPDRCRACVPGTVRCEGAQLVVCRELDGEAVLVRDPCGSNQICQNTLADCNARGTGQNCRCQACAPSDRGCQGAQPVACNADRTAIVSVGQSCGAPENCNQQAGACFACATFDVRCGADGVLEGCLPDRSGFGDLPVAPGGIRCVENNGGARAQSCDRSTLNDRACPSGLCLPGIGCADCDPSPGEFTPECTADGRSLIKCVSGREQPEACEGDDGCVEGTCSSGSCTTESAPAGTDCSLGGGAQGSCDGSGECVECLLTSECSDDGNRCTTTVCRGGSCQHDPVTCPDDGNGCNGVPACDPTDGQCRAPSVPNCDDRNPCTDDSCIPQGGTCDHQPHCGQNERCNATTGACTPLGCQRDSDCNDTVDCTVDTCDTTTGICSRDPDNTRCNDEVACTVDTCTATGCAFQPNDAACVDTNPCTGPGSCSANAPNRGCNFPSVPGQCTLQSGGAGTCQEGTCQTPCQGLNCGEFGCDVANNRCAACNDQVCNARDQPCEDFSCQGTACRSQVRDGQACIINGANGTCEGTVCDVPVASGGGGDDDGDGDGTGGTGPVGGGPPGGGPPGGGQPGGGQPGGGQPGGGQPGGGQPGGGVGGSGGTGDPPTGSAGSSGTTDEPPIDTGSGTTDEPPIDTGSGTSDEPPAGSGGSSGTSDDEPPVSSGTSDGLPVGSSGGGPGEVTTPGSGPGEVTVPDTGDDLSGAPTEEGTEPVNQGDIDQSQAINQSLPVDQAPGGQSVEPAPGGVEAEPGEAPSNTAAAEPAAPDTLEREGAELMSTAA
ncbi:MAG TPA: hypothetical protein VNN80_17785 [Polyangiaceae bacterium]|nr:hypothetical protein [Polyangiaceae bacterium]